MVVTPGDASLASADGGKPQMGVINLVSDETVMSEPSHASLIEYESTRTRRGARSSMAAAAAGFVH